MRGLFELDEVVNAPEKENLLLIDCLNFAFRFKHRGQTDFAAEFLRTIDSFAKSYSAKKVVLLADWKKSAYRLDIYPEYKANRDYSDQTEEEKAKALEFFEGYEKALELAQTRYELLRFEGVEADDLAGYIVKHTSENYPHTWLISSDGDWDLLLSDRVSRFSFVTRREYTVGNFYDNHGCDTPEEFVSLKVLTGDSGDNIIGVDNVGVKRAYNLLRQYGTAMDIYDAMPLPGNQKFIANVNNSEDLILLNYELIDLLSFCEDAIAFPAAENLTAMKEFIDKELKND